MGFLSRFKRIGSYKIFCQCPNCGKGSEVKVPRGKAVNDFISTGECQCDNCGVIFTPDEYTTDFFERRKWAESSLSEKYKDYKTEKAEKEKAQRIKWA